MRIALKFKDARRSAVQADLNLAGAIILGIGSANENNSFGTFYEGAVVAMCSTQAAVTQKAR